LADGTEARTLVRTLNRLYDEEGCAFRVVEVAGGFQLMSRAKFAPWLRRLQAVPTEVRLSVPALETLAVVAYRQPVLRADVEAIRGVQCGEILRQLMERGLVRIVGKSEELGRPFLYGTTRQFLQVFGLRDLDQLPRADWQRREPPANDRPGPDGSDPQQEMSNQPSCFNNPGGDLIVKTTNHTDTIWEDDLATSAVATVDARSSRPVAGPEEFEDADFDDEDEDEDLDEDEDEDLDEDLDDEDFEDSDWEEVEDDEDLDEDEEDLEEEDEEEDWDEEEEDWDEEDDWDEEEEEEEEEDED
jgi:segregation and condensation protein B